MTVLTANAPVAECHVARLLRLRNLPGNNRCADCDAPDPEWASTTLGIFLCVHCCGVHRHLGTHISRVKSIKLDTWPDDLIQRMAAGGNDQLNRKYSAVVPSAYRRMRTGDPSYVREDWIEAKYVRKTFTAAADHANDLFVKGGFLLKKGKDGSKWAQRFFVLSGKHLLYYRHQESMEKPLGTISVAHVLVLLADTKTNRSHTIQVIDGSTHRSYLLSASSGRETMKWVNALRQAKASLLGLEATRQATDQSAFERRLNCEPLFEGWTWFLHDRIDAPAPQLSRWTFLKRRASAVPAHWARYWLVADRQCLRFFPNPMSPFPQHQIDLQHYASAFAVKCDEDDEKISAVEAPLLSTGDAYLFQLNMHCTPAANSENNGQNKAQPDVQYFCASSSDALRWMQCLNDAFRVDCKEAVNRFLKRC